MIELTDNAEVGGVKFDAFGNKATPTLPEKVKEVREATKGKDGFYFPDELLKDHPIKE